MSRQRSLVLFGLVCLIAFAAYYAPFINFKVLYGEIEVGRWAAMMKSFGGPGRDCFYANYEDLNQTLHAMHRGTLPKSPKGLIELPVNCLAKMHLVELRYSAQYNAVSGIYRCEEKDMVQELQLAVYLEPRSVNYENYCKVGSFMEAWDVPVGAATMYGIP